MALFISYWLLAFVGLLGIPVALLVFEVIAAVACSVPNDVAISNGSRPKIAILVPAHNEASSISATINDIKKQMRSGDRILVVADNCTDDTARVAAAAGAEVIERTEPSRMGKGYALNFGIDHLRSDPPAIAIIIDADCRLGEATVDKLAVTCLRTMRPTQALDLMTAPENSAINYRVAEFAWRVKNLVRPLGLYAVNFPCQLMGTGMALPWDLISAANIAMTSIVEDLQLGLNLAKMRHPPLFCPSAKVTSHFPLSTVGASTQRRRWEQGHIGTIFALGIPALFRSIVDRNGPLFVLTLDLLIPPLSFLVILQIGLFALAASLAAFEISFVPVIASAASLSALAIAIFISWLKYGRDVLPASSFHLVGSYFFAKIPIYRDLFFKGGDSKWIATDREKDK